MKRVIYFTYTAFSLFLVFALSMMILHSCKDTTPEPTITVDHTSEQAQQCADALLEYIQPDRYAWAYSEMQGKLNLTVDYVCEIRIYYSDSTKTYFEKYLCYIIGDDVDWEKLESKRIY